MSAPRRWSRRRLLQAFAALGAGAFGLGPTQPLHARPRQKRATGARVVVIGGGAGGATAARYLKHFGPEIDVTLVEPSSSYATCFGGNWYLAGLRSLDALRHGYEALSGHAGVRVVHDTAQGWDADRGIVHLGGGGRLRYDRLVVAPGIDFRWDEVDGLRPDDAERIPHAWKGGAGYRHLRDQVRAMDDGDTVAICTPPVPFRCPPGPYERASLLAHYLKHHKPRSKVLRLDAEFGFSKQGLFEEGWSALYPEHMERIPGSKGGRLERVDAATRRVWTEQGSTPFRPAVLNVIPPQWAGAIARRMDLTDETGWCPVEPEGFESTRQGGVHVLGDAAIAGAMPKSAHSANSQAKVVAAALVAALRGREAPPARLVNTCYSLLAPDYGISIAGVYAPAGGTIEEIGGGVSPEADRDFRRREAAYARGWYRAITDEIYGTAGEFPES